METASKILSQLKTIRQKSEARKQFCNKHQSGFIVTCIECDNEKKTQRERTFQISVLLANSGIKKRFLTANFDSFKAEIESEMNNFQVAKNFAQSFDVMKKRGSNMLMLGNVGNGKNHLAIAMICEVIKKFCVKAKIITAYNLIYEINATYSSSNHKTERQVKREFLDYELLVIDEFDLNRGTNSDQLQLFDVINERYEEMLPTVVISNLSYEELEIRAGQRILSRLLDNGFLLKFTGRDRRKFKVVSGGLS